MTDIEAAVAGRTTKTDDQYFCDWEGAVFGYGYGSGEPHVIPALRTFMTTIDDGRSYDHGDLEVALGAVTAWLLINALCKADIIDYGTSPRFGWLTRKGQRLRDYMLARTEEQLVDLVCTQDEEYLECDPKVCNCGFLACPNPFWSDALRTAQG